MTEICMPAACAVCGSRISRGHVCPGCLCDLPVIGGARCDRCSAPVAMHTRRCERCQRVEYAFDTHVSACVYRDCAASMLRAFKFGRRRSLAPVIAEALWHAIPADWAYDVVVPVPSRRRSVRKRGHNAVDALAEGLGALCERPVLRLLSNVGAREQKVLSYAGRQWNVAGRFRAHRPVDGAPTLLLLDDVFTTGATLSECSRILKANGARLVLCLSFVMEL